MKKKIENVAVLGTGLIGASWAAFYAEKGFKVKLYDADGVFVGLVAGPEQFGQHDAICAGKGIGCTSGGLDVAEDSQKRIVILDPYTSEIRFFTRKKQEAEKNKAAGKGAA